MSGYLELADGALVGVRDGLVLGRVAACDVVVADTKASRRHARLIAESGVVEIEDMNSSNGTLLNGKPVDRRMLRDGDRIEIGKTVIVYREGQLPGRSKPSAAPAADPFADDDDLLGGEDLGSAPAAAPAPAPTPAKADSDDLLGGDDDDLLGGDDEDLLGDAPASAAAPAADVVEFEDEVVEVQKAPPPKPKPAPTPRRDDPLVEVRATPRESKQGGGAAKGAAADDVQPSSGRILQYSKKKGGGGVLGDDLGQMSGGSRLLIVLLVVAVGGGIAYAIMNAMS